MTDVVFSAVVLDFDVSVDEVAGIEQFDSSLIVISKLSLCLSRVLALLRSASCVCRSGNFASKLDNFLANSRICS